MAKIIITALVIAAIYLTPAWIIWNQSKPDGYKPKQYRQAAGMALLWLPFFVTISIIYLLYLARRRRALLVV